jgi:methionyl aminopeptidase
VEGEFSSAELVGLVHRNVGKKKKSNKKKPKAGAAVPTKEQHIRLLTGFTDYYVAHGQTEPPTKPVSELFAKGSFPTGQILPHGKTKYPDPNSSYARLSEEEKRCVSSAMAISCYATR